MSNAIPRSEHPRPQMFRKNWRNLNGEWDFEFDFSRSGLDTKFQETGKFTKKITIPFCPESALSGIGYTDFIAAVWYRRTINISENELTNTVLLHFGAVDYDCHVFLNGKRVGRHQGGYSSFSFDITEHCIVGDNTLVICAQDDNRNGKQPKGKQSSLRNSFGCEYTRTTGIWQTVWLEFVNKTSLVNFKLIPDLNNGTVSITANLRGSDKTTLFAQATFNGKSCGESKAHSNGDTASLQLAITELHPWDIGTPNLYDLKLILTNEDGMELDTVDSYFGLRNVYIKDHSILLNNKPVFQRLVLDQGYYPDGIYTAPSDDAFVKDIELSMSLGFNGARLHEKVFEERFLYHADRLGYMVWGEHANWGLDITSAKGLSIFLPEWLEIINRDFNHPSIVGWCPFNETWDTNGRQQNNDVLHNIYLVTKSLDNTRPVIDASGNYHVITDIYDIHDYEQNIEKFTKHYSDLKKGECYDNHTHRQKYEGQPFFVSEYGGARWSKDNNDNSWGYGNSPKTEEEFCLRYIGLTSALLDSPAVCAFCYTQLYDVEQEKNGLYTYDRKPKFDDDVYHRITSANKQNAAIEK